MPEALVHKDLDDNHLVHVPMSDFAGVTELHYKLVKRKDQVLGPVGQMLWDEIIKTKDR